MKITVAKSAGFCFGVSRALNLVEEELKKGERIVTLGPIIHNEQVVERLKQKGVGMVSSINEVPPGATVVIRSHGVPQQTELELARKGIKYIDATCPFVKKIHNIVNEYHNKGYTIVIIGDKSHPEVQGINGWCDWSAVIIVSEDDIDLEFLKDKKLCIVAQTTMNRECCEKIVKILKNTCKAPIFFDTICNATGERQTEALKIAKEADLCVVIGGKNSSNTCKLYSICKSVCENTVHIEGAWELPDLSGYENIAITAGASTPDWIIKEVLTAMEEKTEFNFAQEIENSLKPLNTGDVVKGTVIGIAPNEVYVDLGFKMDGVVPISELTDDTTVRPDDVVKVGDVIEVFVVRVNDVEGTVTLSKKKLDSIKGWQEIEEAYENKTTLTGKVIEAVNGGVIVLYNGVKVFVPASQANDRYLSDLRVLVNTTVPFRVLDINKRRRKIVGTIKAVLIEEKQRKAQELWSNIEIGKHYKGVVKTLTPFGAFVDIGGVDGLVHISELSWSRIKHPSEILKEGDVIDVYVIEVNPETKKISLGYRRAEDNPWAIAKRKIKEGDILNVKVVRLVPFGAFVEIMPGVDGLVHISQIANRRIAKPSDELHVGQQVTAKVIETDWENQKIGLSIKELLPDEDLSGQTSPAEEVSAPEEGAAKKASLTEILSDEQPKTDEAPVAQDELKAETPSDDSPKDTPSVEEAPEAEEACEEAAGGQSDEAASSEKTEG